MRIALVSTTVFPVLAKDAGAGQVGGAEVQLVQLAGLFRSMGHAVHFVTVHDRNVSDLQVQGFPVHRAYRPAAGWPGLRFLHPRLTGLWSALDRASADIYYTRGAGMLPGVLCMYRDHVRPACRVVFASASDLDFERGRELVRFRRDRWLYRYGLRRVDAIVTQSQQQQRLLAAAYGLASTTVPNFLDAPVSPAPDSGREIVLWVGKLRSLKRPELFVELARRLPQHRFVMIGPRDAAEPGVYDAVAEASGAVANLDFLGFRPFEETEEWFDRARLLVSTSEREGFPNVFLQAMRRGVPIVSFVDPDGMIARDGLGRVVADEKSLVDAVAQLASSPQVAPGPIMECFARRYSAESVRERYAGLFAELVA